LFNPLPGPHSFCDRAGRRRLLSFGLRYQALLAREASDVTVRPSSGSVENIDLLRKGKADVAFVQGGTGQASMPSDCRSLQAFTTSPSGLWCENTRASSSYPISKDTALDLTKRAAEPGQVALLLLADSGIDPKAAKPSAIGGRGSRGSLRAGKLDAAFFVISPRAPIVRRLLPSLASASEHKAGSGLRTATPLFSTVLTLPKERWTLRAKSPPRETALLAPATTSSSANSSIRHWQSCS